MAVYHSPPEGVCIAGEICFSVDPCGVLLRQVDKVGREDEAQETNVQRRDQLLKKIFIFSSLEITQCKSYNSIFMLHVFR